MNKGRSAEKGPSGPGSQRVLDLLYELSSQLDGEKSFKVILKPLLRSLNDHLNLRHATITLRNPDGDETLIEVAQGLSREQARKGRYKPGEGVTGKVFQSGKPAIISKVSKSPHFVNYTGRAGRKEFSFICVPVKIGKEVVGTLSADRDFQPKSVLEEDVRLLSIVASMIAQVVKTRRSVEENRRKLEDENRRLKEELKNRFKPSNIIGNSHEMQIVYDQIAQVSSSSATTLILGETGTGKELVARAIHYNSNRAEKPFIRVHCAALAESVIESELFGHVAGAFTGATSDRKGRFELAHGGTLFLDEVAEIPSSIQTKLLRVLQEREFERVGGTKTIRVNVRLIAATNKDLQSMSATAEFREDLYYRLNVFPIFVPPLRKRKADIALLADFFLERYSREYTKDVRRFSSAVIDMLYAYHWPGNVRELENTIERAVVVCEGEVIHPYHLPPTLQTAEESGTAPERDLKSMVDMYERDIIVDALKSSRGNISAAARLLKTTQRIMGYKIEKHQINPKRYST